MRFRFLFFILCCFLFSIKIGAQGLVQKGDGQYANDLKEEAKNTYLQAIAEENMEDSTKARVYFQISDYYLDVSFFDSTDFYLNRSLELAEKINDNALIADIYFSKHYNYDFQGDITNAHEYVLLADSLFQSLGDQKNHGMCLSRLGSAMQKMMKDSLALVYFDEALEIHKDLGFDRGIARTMQAKSFYYSYLFEDTGDENYLVKSLECVEEAIQYFREAGDMIPVANCLNMLSEFKRDTGDFAGALKDSQESLKLARENDSRMGVVWNYNSISDLFLMQEKFEVAELYADSAYIYAKEVGMRDAESSALSKQAEILYYKGDFESAFGKLYEYMNLNDTIYSNENYQLQSELQAQYDSAKKDQEIAAAAFQKEIDDNQKFWLIGLILLGTIASVLIIAREIKARKKAKALYVAEKKIRILEEEKLKEQLDYKNRELTSMALQIAQKNEMMNSLKEELNDLAKSGEGNGKLRDIQNKLRVENQMEGFWDQFTRQFNETHTSFFKKLTTPYPDLTKNELRLASLIRMNLSTKEMASILNITDEGIKKARYRMRKKLDLQGEEGLEQHLLKF